MTFILYILWIAAIMAVLTEIDHLITRPLLERTGAGIPEVHWGIVPVASVVVPGVGQFLNGQITKALFAFFWPFLTMFGQPVPRPWQMLGIKTVTLLLPWYIVQVGDALLFALLQNRRRLREDAEMARLARSSERAVDMSVFLERRKQRQDQSDS